jgi:hypothetical protein
MFTQRTRTHTHTHMHTHTHTHTHAHTRTRTYACRHRPFTYSLAFICRRIRSASRQRSDPLFLFLRQMLVYVLPLLFWIHSFISSSSSHHIHNAICTYAVIHSYCRCLYVRIHRVLEPFYALHLTPMRCLLISGPVGPLICCTGVICRSAPFDSDALPVDLWASWAIDLLHGSHLSQCSHFPPYPFSSLHHLLIIYTMQYVHMPLYILTTDVCMYVSTPLRTGT